MPGPCRPAEPCLRPRSRTPPLSVSRRAWTKAAQVSEGRSSATAALHRSPRTRAMPTSRRHATPVASTAPLRGRGSPWASPSCAPAAVVSRIAGRRAARLAARGAHPHPGPPGRLKTAAKRAEHCCAHASLEAATHEESDHQAAAPPAACCRCPSSRRGMASAGGQRLGVTMAAALGQARALSKTSQALGAVYTHGVAPP
jgi:hypothetical protein